MDADITCERHAMKNVARLFAAASVVVSGFALVGCQQDDAHRDQAALRGDDASVAGARTAGSSSGAIDALGRTHSQSPSTSGPGVGGVGTVPGPTPGAAVGANGARGTAAGVGGTGAGGTTVIGGTNGATVGGTAGTGTGAA